MSEDQLKAFFEKVQGDTTLQEKLKAAADADAVTAIVKEAGFSLTAGDLKQGLSKVSAQSWNLQLAAYRGPQSEPGLLTGLFAY